MPKRNKTEESTPIQMGFSSMVGGISPLVDQLISLNPKKGPFFMIGDISLSEDRYWAKISPNMPEDYYRILSTSLREGYIVRGKTKIYAVDKKEGVLEAWSAVVSVEGRSSVCISAFRNLIKLGQEGNHSLLEITDYCLDIERRGKNRADTVSLLEEVRTYASPNSLYDKAVYDEADEDKEGKIEVSIIKTPDGPRVLAKGPSSDTNKGPGSASRLLDNVLEI